MALLALLGSYLVFDLIVGCLWDNLFSNQLVFQLVRTITYYLSNSIADSGGGFLGSLEVRILRELRMLVFFGLISTSGIVNYYRRNFLGSKP